MNRQYRQGDVLLCAIDRIPPEAKPAPTNGDRVIVALGELTGHAHAFAAAEAQLFQEKSSRRSFLVIGEKGARLCHEEHHPILVPEGRYGLRHQREYTPEMPRHVRD
jgi:hypothetical protein